MTDEKYLAQIAASLDNIHQVLIHLTNSIKTSGDPSLDKPPFNHTPSPDPALPVSNNASGDPPTPDPQPSANGNSDLEYQDFAIETITFGVDDNGNDIYKGRGHPFQKFGVRIWPEVFKRLGVSIEDLVTGENTISPIHVRAVLNEYGNPRKIVGLAPGDPPAQDNPSPMPEPNNDAPPIPEPYPQRDVRKFTQSDDEIPF